MGLSETAIPQARSGEANDQDAAANELVKGAANSAVAHAGTVSRRIVDIGN